MRIVGVDYSMTCPAVCLFEGKKLALDKCKIHYRMDGNKLVSNELLHGIPQCDWTSDEHRYWLNSEWAMNLIRPFKPELVVIEGYSFASKGRVFGLAENTGILKHRLWKEGFTFITPAPSTVKKVAAGKGNANKEYLNDAFVAQTGVDIKKMTGQTAKSWNPSSDIIDAYYMVKYGLAFLNAEIPAPSKG